MDADRPNLPKGCCDVALLARGRQDRTLRDKVAAVVAVQFAQYRIVLDERDHRVVRADNRKAGVLRVAEIACVTLMMSGGDH